MPSVTQSELDKFKAGFPVVTVAPQCHRDAPVRLIYLKAEGVLVVRCNTCGGYVAEIEVARGETAP